MYMYSLSSVAVVRVEQVSGYLCTVYRQWRMLGRTGVRIYMYSLSSVVDVGVEQVSGYLCTVYRQWRMLG
jgi:hypothetical protein